MGPRYRFGKGPLITAFEEYVADGARAAKLLTQLQKRDYKDVASYEAKRNWTTFERSLSGKNLEHLETDVFGPGSKQQSDAAKAEALRRGRERRLIYCQGIRAALELAFGIGKGETPPAGVDPAPLEVFWSCGNGANQCFVAWNETPTRHVTVNLLSNEPAMAWDDGLVAPVEGFPEADQGRRGFFVFAADENGKLSVSSTKAELGVPPSPTTQKMVKIGAGPPG
jgi:hypothetical protein